MATDQQIQRDLGPILQGSLYRQNHRASVIGILGSDAPPVYSKGARFYNRDRWTARWFTKEMCEWAKGNPGCMPTKNEVGVWARAANQAPSPSREIVIANTPNKLPLRLALALTGGAYHESFHTKYSRRHHVLIDEMSDIVLPRWAKVDDWSKYLGALLTWMNVVEDIWIERRGREEFDGVYVKLCDLQDFILSQEAVGMDNLRSHGKKPGALSTILRCFRDIGLGYNTETQRMALMEYQQDSPEALLLVTEGPLAPILREAIGLKIEDDLGCLRLAMDVIAILAKMGGHADEDSKAEEGNAGDGKVKCPACGAEASSLKVRPMPDGRGGKIKGKGLVTCTVCGYQEEVDVVQADDAQPGSSESGDGPQIEGFDESDVPKSKDKDGDPQEGSGGKSDGEEGEDGSEGAGAGGNNGSGDSEGNGSGKDDDPEEGDENEGAREDEGEEASDEDSLPIAADGEEEIGKPDDDEEGGQGAGGHHYDEEEHPGIDWETLINEALNQAESGEDLGILDNNAALEGAVGTEQAKANRDVKEGESPWSPYDAGLDSIVVVGVSREGKAHDLQQADALLTSVKTEISFLRARLRTVVKTLMMKRRVHGVPKGRNLSSRFLVHSKTKMKAGETPDRAYYRKGLTVDMTMACVVLIDESSSMVGSKQKEATRMMCALTEPFDALHCPTMAVGFRDGQRAPGISDDGGTYHRSHGVIYDIFKTFGERFMGVRWRFANTRAVGGTPMSDGIQFSLNALDQREENHRFLFVVTDGQPNWGHEPVIRWQIRRAKAAGIHLIGVGIGNEAVYVKTLFPDHVWALTVGDFPRLLLSKINELVDVRGYGRKPKRLRSVE